MAVTVNGSKRTMLPNSYMRFLNDFKLTYRYFHAGDVLYSLADISKAKQLLCYDPSHRIVEGLGEVLEWYVDNNQ